MLATDCHSLSTLPDRAHFHSLSSILLISSEKCKVSHQFIANTWCELIAAQNLYFTRILCNLSFSLSLSPTQSSHFHSFLPQIITFERSFPLFSFGLSPFIGLIVSASLLIDSLFDLSSTNCLLLGKKKLIDRSIQYFGYDFHSISSQCKNLLFVVVYCFYLLFLLIYFLVLYNGNGKRRMLLLLLLLLFSSMSFLQFR